MHTKDVGDIAEVAITLNALKKGWSVSKPVGENQRYDLILDDGVSLLKVQCKSAKLKQEIISASLTRMTRLKDKYKRETYTEQEIDAFGIYCPDIQQCFLIKIKELTVDGKAQGSVNLRLKESTGNNQHHIRLAKDYMF